MRAAWCSGALHFRRGFGPIKILRIVFLKSLCSCYMMSLYCLSDSLARWLSEFLNQPYYGKKYANFSRFPESKDIWRTCSDPSAAGSSGRFVTDWEYGGAGTMNILIGGVALCNLVDHVLINGKMHRQICIHPLDGEWQRFVTMIGSVYMKDALEFNTYKNAFVVGTKGVSGKRMIFIVYF